MGLHRIQSITLGVPDVRAATDYFDDLVSLRAAMDGSPRVMVETSFGWSIATGDASFPWQSAPTMKTASEASRNSSAEQGSLLLAISVPRILP